MIAVIANCRIAAYIQQIWQEMFIDMDEEHIDMDRVLAPGTRSIEEIIGPAEDTGSNTKAVKATPR